MRGLVSFPWEKLGGALRLASGFAHGAVHLSLVADGRFLRTASAKRNTPPVRSLTSRPRVLSPIAQGVLPQHSRPVIAHNDPNDERKASAEPRGLHFSQRGSGGTAREAAAPEGAPGGCCGGRMGVSSSNAGCTGGGRFKSCIPRTED